MMEEVDSTTLEGMTLPLPKKRGSVSTSGDRRKEPDLTFWRTREPSPDGAPLPPVIDYMPLVNIPRLSPVVFYGPSGSGKSHLARGIYREFRRFHPKERGIFLTADEFYRSFTEAVGKQETVRFRHYFTGCRILVLEDIDYLENHPNGREVLTALLRDCEDSGTLVLLTLKSFPGDLVSFPETLRARLVGGFLVPVAFPEPDSKRLLLQYYARIFQTHLTPVVLDFMVESFPQPVGEFYALFSQMFHLFDWRDHPPVISKMKELLKERPVEKVISFDAILKTTAAHYAVKVSEIKSPSRLRTVVAARNMALWIARQITPLTLMELGKTLSGRDHSTILHALRQMEEKCQDDPETQRAYQQILDKLGKLV